MSAPQLINQAFRHLETGNLAQAESLCRSVLETEPRNVAALHTLGVIKLQTGHTQEAIQQLLEASALQPGDAAILGHVAVALVSNRQPDEAMRFFRKSLDIAPRDPDTLYNYAKALHTCGMFKEAVSNYRAVLGIQPNLSEVHFNLGNTLRDMGKLDEAVRSYRDAIRLKPDYLKALNNLGIVLRQLRRYDEAARHLREALRIKPDYVPAHQNLGLAFVAQRRFDDAIACHRRALELQPDFHPVRNSLGKLFAERKQFDEATALLDGPPVRQCVEAYWRLAEKLREADRVDESLAWARKGVEGDPKNGMARNVLATVLQHRGELDAAMVEFRQALELRPDLAEAMNNLGVVHQIVGDDETALRCFRKAAWLRPTLAIARLNHSVCKLRAGDYAEGWHSYEWRRCCTDLRFVKHAAPVWDGSDVPDETILIEAEQGLGDTIQFIRYAPLIRQRCAHLIVRCPQTLTHLLSSCKGIDQFVSGDMRLPKFDRYLWSASLPGAFQTTLETIPTDIPYLQADPTRVEAWRDRLASYKGLKVGIAWQGNPQYGGDRYRSIPLRFFATLARVPGITFFNLQKGLGCEQITPLADALPLVQFGDEFDTAGAFCDTAAIVNNLDLVISSDTAVPHLAGALARPVWVALHVSSDWRFHDRGEVCHWYPTMRLFRQTKLHDWQPVFDQIAAELQTLADQRSGAATARAAATG
jgi:tetratricopeptide (TPR) repeat protein